MDYAAVLPLTHSKFFKPADMVGLLAKVEGHPKQAEAIATADLYDPTMVLAISIILGWCGVDRLFLKQYLLGILKLVTLGGWGVWWIIDVLTVISRTKTQNYRTVLKQIEFYGRG